MMNEPGIADIKKEFKRKGLFSRNCHLFCSF